MAEKIYSPFRGRAIKITEVNDAMFSQKLLGDGVAVYPEYKTGLFAKKSPLFAPVDGEVILVFSEKHAVGFRTPEGNEILVHMGVDTVELKGAPFTITTKVGDIVKHGQQIGEVNFKAIEKANLDTVTPIIFTNAEGREITVLCDSGNVDENTPLYEIQ